MVILALIFFVVIIDGTNIFFKFIFLLVEIQDDVVVLFLLFEVDSLNILYLLPEFSQLLDFRSELLLSILYFLFDLSYSFGDLLQGLVLQVIEHLFLVGDALDLVFDGCVSGNTLLFLQALHEVTQVFRPTLKDLLGPVEDGHLRLDFGENFLHLLVLGVLSPQVGGILPEVIPLHILSTLGPGVFALFIGHGLFEGLLFQLQLFYLILLPLLFLSKHRSLGLEDAKFVVLRCVDLELIIEDHALLLHSLDIVCESLELTLGSHWLLQKKLGSLEPIPFVIELTTKDLVLDLPVFTSLGPQIVKHLVWGKVLRGDFLDVHESLSNLENILLMILDHPSKFPFLFIEFGVVFLLLSQLGSGLEKSLEVLLVALALKQVDFCEQLLLLLLKLIDLLLELARVHTLVPHMINILMGRLELSL